MEEEEEWDEMTWRALQLSNKMWLRLRFLMSNSSSYPATSPPQSLHNESLETSPAHHLPTEAMDTVYSQYLSAIFHTGNI